MNILFAYYDLKNSPPSYDFLIFLQNMEIHRQNYGFDEIILTFQPGPNEGFRFDKMPTSINERRQMFDNIVLPACRLLPSIKEIRRPKERVIVPASDYSVFPYGYTSEIPVIGYMTSKLLTYMYVGKKPFNWIIPEYADKLIDNIDDGRKIVTINLRENPDYPSRNSNMQAWERFVHRLDKSIYKPVIVRETNKIGLPIAGFNGITIYDAASVDLVIRAALYKRAFVNMFVPNGPMGLSWFQMTRTALLKPIDESVISTSSQWLRTMYAMDKEESPQMQCLTKSHKYYWTDDSVENIQAAFQDIVEQPITEEVWDDNPTLHLETVLYGLRREWKTLITPESIVLYNLLEKYLSPEMWDTIMGTHKDKIYEAINSWRRQYNR